MINTILSAIGVILLSAGFLWMVISMCRDIHGRKYRSGWGKAPMPEWMEKEPLTKAESLALVRSIKNRQPVTIRGRVVRPGRPPNNVIH